MTSNDMQLQIDVKTSHATPEIESTAAFDYYQFKNVIRFSMQKQSSFS